MPNQSDPDPDDVVPLDVFLTLMRRAWAAGDEKEAVAMAKLAAPFLHPRAAASRAPGTMAEASDDDLDD